MASPFRFSLPLALGLTAIGLVAQAPTHHGIDPANLDTSVKPCQDFYHFANGGWLKSHTLPADKAMLGSFTEVMDRNREILKQILDETSAKRTWPKGSVQQKVGDFFASGMDEKAIEKRGLAPMKPIFATIDGLKDTKELPAVLAKLHNEGIPGGFGFYVGPDDKDSNRNLGAFHQGGLGLPDRDYYLNNDARTKDIRAKYVAHVAKMFELAGDPAGLAAARARVVLDLETKMAKAAWSRVELRDPQKTYNKMSLAKLGQEAPGFDWALYFKDRGVKLEDLNVGQPSYATAFAKLATDTPAIEWRTYLRWHALHDAASVLPKAFGAENFAFYGKVLSGTPEQETRWKRVEGMEDGVLGEALGQLYVKAAFSPQAKAHMHPPPDLRACSPPCTRTRRAASASTAWCGTCPSSPRPSTAARAIPWTPAPKPAASGRFSGWRAAASPPSPPAAAGHPQAGRLHREDRLPGQVEDLPLRGEAG